MARLNHYTILVPANGVTASTSGLCRRRTRRCRSPSCRSTPELGQPRPGGPRCRPNAVGQFPDPTPGNWYYAIGNTDPAPVRFDITCLTILTVTNDPRPTTRS